MVLTWLSLAITFVLLILFPLVFSELMVVSLAKLHLDPGAAASIIITVMLGGLVDIPIARIPHKGEILIHPLTVFGLSGLWPEIRRVRRETIIAVNVGGCLIPAGLACYELIYLATVAPSTLSAAAVASIIAVVICYLTARPTPGVGIVIPGLVPAFAAAISAVILAPEQTAPVAFIAGVAGPLIGADILHLKDISRLAPGMVSIGGAGTFDGIVLSAIVAAYLA
jgi:uncharacterized membrane protein